MEDKLLGLRIVVKHKSGKTTEIYTHVSRKNLRKIVSPIDTLDFKRVDKE